MAERAPAADVIQTSVGSFRLRETVAYPNGGHVRYRDYVVRMKYGLLGVEENG